MPAEAAPQPPVQPLRGDRRPLASRDTHFARRATAWLVARRVSANAISVSGMVAGVAAGAALAATSSWPDGQRWWWLAAAALVQLRLLCNMLDGMVAIGSDTASPVGELYNEVPDRVADSAVLIGLGYAAGGEPWLGWAAALLAMLTAYVRTLGKAMGAGSDFGGPMAKPHRMFVVTLAALWLGTTPPSWHPTITGNALPALALALITAGSALTALRRLGRVAFQLRGRE